MDGRTMEHVLEPTPRITFHFEAPTMTDMKSASLYSVLATGLPWIGYRGAARHRLLLPMIQAKFVSRSQSLGGLSPKSVTTISLLRLGS